MFKAWYQDHIESPYPSEEDKAEMSHMTGLTLNQVRHVAASSFLSSLGDIEDGACLPYVVLARTVCQCHFHF